MSYQEAKILKTNKEEKYLIYQQRIDYTIKKSTNSNFITGP